MAYRVSERHFGYVMTLRLLFSLSHSRIHQLILKRHSGIQNVSAKRSRDGRIKSPCHKIKLKFFQEYGTVHVEVEILARLSFVNFVSKYKNVKIKTHKNSIT